MIPWLHQICCLNFSSPMVCHPVETNVGKCFLELIDRHFPKSNPYSAKYLIATTSNEATAA
jgi:hypothetical protein